jgi:hypothetical protein
MNHSSRTSCVCMGGVVLWRQQYRWQQLTEASIIRVQINYYSRLAVLNRVVAVISCQVQAVINPQSSNC